jgi:hypothetical protein
METGIHSWEVETSGCFNGCNYVLMSKGEGERERERERE